MTIDASAAHEGPLLTESDMLTRIRNLLAPGVKPGQLWVLFLDGLRRQTPLMMPIDECPDLPDAAQLDTLGRVLATAVRDQTGGRGSVIFVRERLGVDRPTIEDHCWAAGLAGAGERAGVQVAGTFLLTPHRVQPLAP